MTPDEVRLLDNSKALLFIRGFPAVMDDKYDLNHHPNVHRTASGGYLPYVHSPQTYVPITKAFNFGIVEKYELIDETEETEP